MDKIRKVLEEPLKEMNLIIDDISYVNKELRIVLDTPDDTIIDLDLIVKASRMISPILDEYDFIKEHYILDVSSKEKGVKENER